MSKTFFSIDVETTSTNPFKGELLTVGIVPVSAEDLHILDEGLHVRLAFDMINVDMNTLKWWMQEVSEESFEAAWGKSGHRSTPVEAANWIDEYVHLFADTKEDTIFAANPVSFDHPWVLKLFTQGKVEMPFNHRTICMRSMYFGITGGEWGKNRSDDTNWHHPELPHHALSDAKAQALDLIQMYRMCHENLRTNELKATAGDVYD